MTGSAQPIEVFSVEHIRFLTAEVLLGAAVIAWGRKKQSESGKQKLLVGLWGLFTCVELLKYLHFALYPETFSLKTGLPFHLCSISLFTYPLAIFTDNEDVKNFIYAVNMPGAFFALVTPDIGHASAFSFYFLHLMAAHTLIVLIPLYMVCCGLLRPNVRCLPAVAGILLLTMIPAALLNRWIGSNYYFINGPVPGTLTQTFADRWGASLYWLPMLLLLAVVWGILYLPFLIGDIKKIKRRKFER